MNLILVKILHRPGEYEKVDGLLIQFLLENNCRKLLEELQSKVIYLNFSSSLETNDKILPKRCYNLLLRRFNFTLGYLG